MTTTASPVLASTPGPAAAPAARAGAGVLLALVSAASFGASGALAASLLASGWSPGAAVALRIAGGAVALAPLALPRLRGRWRALWAARWRVLAFGLLAVAGCQLAYFTAVRSVPVPLALLLEYSGVLLVVLWTWLVGGRRPRALTAAGGVVALAGLVLVLGVRLGGGAAVGGAGLAWGALAAVCLAVYFVLAARPDDDLPPLATAWAGMVVGALALGAAGAVGVLPLAASTADVTLLGTAVPWWAPLAALALVSTALAYATGVVAVQRLGASTGSFLALTEVLFAAAWAWAALGQGLSAVQLVGGAVVLAGVVLVRVDDLRGPRGPGAAGAQVSSSRSRRRAATTSPARPITSR